jgi:iron complex outermembrane recepter protein
MTMSSWVSWLARAGSIALWVVVLSSRAVGAQARPAHADSAVEAASDTLKRVVTLPAVEVSTTRVDRLAPVARVVMTRDDIARHNWGQDTPMVLATLPGAYAYSDAGNGIGYTYLSVRGFPQRRISVLIDGVPLNDPESHEVYWIDHPDLLASTTEAQLQRGAGSALYGAAALGGSVNLETAPFASSPRFGAALAYGSFETRRIMLEGGSGPLAGGWDLYGRYSRIETDGYRERSDSRLWSYALSTRRSKGAHSLRLNLYGGPEETHLAYLGVPRAYLDGALTGDRERDRRFNPITYQGERDHFFEPHYELIHSWTPAPHLALTQTLFFFDGEGFYDEQRLGHELADYRLAPWAVADSMLYPRDYYARDSTGALIQDGSGRFIVERADLVRRRTVKNRHYGWIPRARIEHGGGALTVGGEIRGHDGRHIGEVLGGNGLPPSTPPEHRYYDYHPRTLSAGLFLREEWQAAPRLRATADLAWRHQEYLMRGDRFDAVRFERAYDFALPRLGVTWTPRPEVVLFGAWSHARREPALRDLYDAEQVVGSPLYRPPGYWVDPGLRPERVHDWELGGSWTGAGLALAANLFRMDFEDELVYAGQFNTDLGYPTIGNAARSVHQGLELAAAGKRALGAGLDASLEANLTLGDNHFVEYREVYGTSPGDTVRYDGNAIGFFPATLANVDARLSWRGARLGVEAQHAGRIYLDNTEDRDAGIAPRTVVNLVGGYRLPLGEGGAAELSLRVLNALDHEYETGGYAYSFGGVRYMEFIPAATRHFLAEVKLEF